MEQARQEHADHYEPDDSDDSYSIYRDQREMELVWGQFAVDLVLRKLMQMEWARRRRFWEGWSRMMVDIDDGLVIWEEY